MHLPVKVLLLAAVCLLTFAGMAGATTNVAGSTGATYIVVYKGTSVSSDAAATISRAGGTLVYSYDQIGVVIARSDNASFRDNLLKDSRIENASATAGFATQLPSEQAAEGPPPGDLTNTPVSDTDSLSPLQWDMRQIKTPQAHAITGGSPAVLVGDIDTGIDFTHPDLAANIDVANSANCLSGAPVPGLAAQDDNGHGTHTAGTIAAAANGIGIVGVAPNVKIAGIKTGNAEGYFFPEAVVCAFVWAAEHNVDVTNNSYFADPYLFNCKNDPTQRAIWNAEARAIQFAEAQGVTVVAAEGNQAEDTAHPTQDATSPDFPPGSEVVRPVTNACAIIPVEVPGVIGVSGVGNARQTGSDGQPDGYLKSFYSSFGVGVTQVTAPGGDSIFGRTPEAVNGRVLSTWPASLSANCTRRVIEAGPPLGLYCYLQGTSMASPHAAGTAALIISRFGKMSPGQVSGYLGQTADSQPCPSSLPAGYLAFLGADDGKVQTCQGGASYNSWYGHGQVNAFNAVTHTPGS